MNVPRNYHLALLPLSPLLQTFHPESPWRWLYETFERMENWMEGQEGELNDAITLSALSPAGRECICQSEVPISVVDLNDVAHDSTPLVLSKYQSQCQNLLLFYQIASLISALSSNWFGLLCCKSGNIEQRAKETWIAEMKAWFVNHRLRN